MSIKQTFKKWMEEGKKRKAKLSEIRKIQSKSYYDSMKKQAKIMGQKQAELEAKQRAKVYEYKLKRKIIKPNQKNKKGYNWITGKYE